MLFTECLVLAKDGSKLVIFRLAKSGKWQIWQCILWAIFDVQSSYGCLKVSEFDQEFISEVKDH